MGQLQERIDIEAGKIQLGVGGIVAGESGLAVGCQVGAFKLSCQIVGGGAIGSAGVQRQAAQRLAADGKAGECGMCGEARVVEGSNALDGKTQCAGGVQALATQGFKAGDIDAGGGGVQLEAMRCEIEAGGGGDLA